MSARRELATAGLPLTDLDLQRANDAAAEADSIMDETLLTPPNSGVFGTTFVKSVVPLGYEFSPAGGGYTNPALLVVPATSFGTALLPKPFRCIAAQQLTGSIGGTPSLPAINPVTVGPSQVSATGLSAAYNAVSPASLSVSNGDPTHDRIDVLFAVLNRSTSVSGTRVFKDPTSGQVSLQSVNLATDPGLGFGILPGTPAITPIAPTLPADTSTTWYFPLANIYVPALFNAATTLLGSSGSHISQAWTAGGIDARRVKEFTDMGSQNFMATGITRSTAVFARWSSEVNFVTAIHLPPGVPATYVIIDQTIDWRKRLLHIRAFRAPSQGSGALYPSPELVTVAGSPSNSVDLYGFSGGGGSVFFSGGTPSLVFNVDVSGNLQFDASGGVTDGTHGDDYLIWVEATPQFVGPNV